MLTLFLIISLHHVLHLKTLDFDVFNPSFINLEVPVWCILIWHGQRAQNRFPQGSGNSHGRLESPWISKHHVHLCGKKPPVPCWNIQQSPLTGSDHRSKELRIFWVSLIFGNEKLLSSILERDQRSREFFKTIPIHLDDLEMQKNSQQLFHGTTRFPTWLWRAWWITFSFSELIFCWRRSP